MATIGVIGLGRLGLCFALNLERAGFDVVGIDIDSKLIESINSKKLKSNEPLVEEYLRESENFRVSTDIAELMKEEINHVFLCVPTPSKTNGIFDHQFLDLVCDGLLKLGPSNQLKNIIINSTVMPGYCESLSKRMEVFDYTVSYNPEFIAQGTIIYDQQFPDQVLIGEANESVGEEIEAIYRCVCKNEPRFSKMNPTEAEITKLAVNCFLTTKIAFANSIGDLSIQFGVNPENVLGAIGADQRIGSNFLKYGFGYGGPCLPRDNRAMHMAANSVNLELPISISTDKANKLHREFQRIEMEKRYKKENQITFNGLSYKQDSDIIEESQRLELAIDLARLGYSVLLSDSESVISQIRAIHGQLFSYEIIK